MKGIALAMCSWVVLAAVDHRVRGVWGEEGHRIVNRLAAEQLPPDAPEFLRAAADRLAFLGPEPDRWRDRREHHEALRVATAPDHFIDLEEVGEIEHLPGNRHAYAARLRARGVEPTQTGFLPYAILEYYQRVQVLFRLWRETPPGAERAHVEQNIIYYAGVLGHFVADGAVPLHTTVHYDGWSTAVNPERFTRGPIHHRFEAEYVRARVEANDLRPLLRPARALDDVFSETVRYLVDSHAHVRPLYELDRVAAWGESNEHPPSKAFTVRRLAAGAQMLADLWYSAWVGSAPPRGAPAP